MNLLNRASEPGSALSELDWIGLIEQESDPGLGNGGLGRLAACFMDSMATLQLPAMGYGLRYEYGMFKQFIRDGWQEEQPDNWLRRPDPWEVPRPDERVEIKFGCTFTMRDGDLGVIPHQPSTLIGMPFDRPVAGYGVDTVNTLRLWGAFAPDYFDFGRFSAGQFVGSGAKDYVCSRSISSLPAPWLIWFVVSGAQMATGLHSRTKWPFSSTILTRRSPSRS
jgi:starch phosphorylase